MTKTFKARTSEDNRATLVGILRDSSRWPEGFTWDFNSYENCAIYLLVKHPTFKGTVASFLGLPQSEVNRIFYRAGRPITGFKPEMVDHVTPEQVANLLVITYMGNAPT